MSILGQGSESRNLEFIPLDWGKTGCNGTGMHSQHSGSELKRTAKFEASLGNIKLYFRKENKKKNLSSLFLSSPKVINTHTNRF